MLFVWRLFSLWHEHPFAIPLLSTKLNPIQQRTLSLSSTLALTYSSAKMVTRNHYSQITTAHSKSWNEIKNYFLSTSPTSGKTKVVSVDRLKPCFEMPEHTLISTTKKTNHVTLALSQNNTFSYTYGILSPKFFRTSLLSLNRATSFYTELWSLHLQIHTRF